MANTIETQERPRRGPEPPDLSEKGGMKNGEPQRSDERLFMQLLAFGGCPDARLLASALDRAGVSGVLYEDVNDPRGVALLTFSPDPGMFVDRVRPLLNSSAASAPCQTRRRSRRSSRSPNTRCSAPPTRSDTSRIFTKC